MGNILYFLYTKVGQIALLFLCISLVAKVHANRDFILLNQYYIPRT